MLSTKQQSIFPMSKTLVIIHDGSITAFEFQTLPLAQLSNFQQLAINGLRKCISVTITSSPSGYAQSLSIVNTITFFFENADNISVILLQRWFMHYIHSRQNQIKKIMILLPNFCARLWSYHRSNNSNNNSHQTE